jgi:putative cell wall-binding protein
MKKFMLHPLIPDSVIVESENPNELYLVTDKQIYISYDKEYDDLTYEPQISRLILHSDSVYFDKMGRYHDEFMIQTLGQMAKQRLAEMLPFEYQPSDSVLINTDFR